MEIKARSRMSKGQNVSALTALHRDEWSSLFPMLNEYGLNGESVKAMTTAVRSMKAVSFLFFVLLCFFDLFCIGTIFLFSYVWSVFQLCALSLDDGGSGSITSDCRAALYNGHENRLLFVFVVSVGHRYLLAFFAIS
jgi:hypothetical protein